MTQNDLFPRAGCHKGVDGTLATKTDAKNQETQYTYDAYGELIQVSRGTVSGGTFTENTSQRINYTYGQQGASNITAGRPQTITYTGPVRCERQSHDLQQSGQAR